MLSHSGLCNCVSKKVLLFLCHLRHLNPLGFHFWICRARKADGANTKELHRSAKKSKPMSLYISTGSMGYILGIKRAFRDIENPEV